MRRTRKKQTADVADVPATAGVDWSPVRSSWIDAIGYQTLAAEHRDSAPAGHGLILVRTHGSQTNGEDSRTYVYLAPTWIYALLIAANARGRSVGRIYTRVLKGKYQSTLVT